MKPLRSPLKWAGGKRWLAPKVAEMFRESGATRIVEPFCGAASVSLHARPQYAWLNDANYNLIKFWRCVKDGEILDDVGGNDRDDYSRAREEYNVGGMHRRRMASLFYYLNRTCFNGLYRVNSDGDFNVPFGKHTTINYRSTFPEITEAMMDWEFTCQSFVWMDTEPTDFVYIDPPYDGGFTGFTEAGFTWDDQVTLATWAAKHPGTVVISNSATQRIQWLYLAMGFDVDVIDAPRSISCDGDRKKAKEVLAIKKKNADK